MIASTLPEFPGSNSGICDRKPQRCKSEVELTHDPLVVEYAPGDLLTRDVSGMEDALWHLLERSRVLLNDRCPVNVMWKTASLDRGLPRVRVMILPASWPLRCEVIDPQRDVPILVLK